jgi:uncharacterized tellurite resistance protein B-like protein
MLSALKRIFDEAVDRAAADGDADEHAVRRAVAALLVEMSRADRDESAQERAHIEAALERVFHLSGDEVRTLMEAGSSGADEATSLFEFTSVLNRAFDHDRKVLFVEELWRIAYADGEIEKHEAHLVRKVADLLHLRHHEYIGAKLRAGES